MENKLFIAFIISNLIGLIYLFCSLNDGFTVSEKTRNEITGFNEYKSMHSVRVHCKNGTEICEIVN
jgi:hypothetical protein